MARQEETIDHMIRSALRLEVRLEEPSAATRESLLAMAAADNTLRSSLGPAVPPLVAELHNENGRAIDWSVPVTTSIPVARRQLLMLAAPLYAVR